MHAMARDTEIVAARRARLAEWIDRECGGSQTAFIAAAKTRGYNVNQGELSALLKDKSFGENKAQTLEIQGAMPKGYLVHPLLAPFPQFAIRELAEMGVVMQALARALALSIPPAGAEFVDELDRMKPPQGSFAASIVEAVRAELPLSRTRTRT